MHWNSRGQPKVVLSCTLRFPKPDRGFSAHGVCNIVATYLQFCVKQLATKFQACSFNIEDVRARKPLFISQGFSILNLGGEWRQRGIPKTKFCKKIKSMHFFTISWLKTYICLHLLSNYAKIWKKKISCQLSFKKFKEYL